jgi:hypothetical protein
VLLIDYVTHNLFHAGYMMNTVILDAYGC